MNKLLLTEVKYYRFLEISKVRTNSIKLRHDSAPATL